MNARPAIVFGLVTALLVTAWWGAVSSREPPKPEAQARGGRDLLVGIQPRHDALDSLAGLRWADVKPTADAAMADLFVRDRIVAETTAREEAPLVYLRGLLVLAQGKPEAALAEFDRIDPKVIPAEFLYAPYRLRAELEPGRSNPHGDLLREAVDRGEVEPLLAARMKAASGDAVEAIAGYLRTDPARWTSRDVGLLGVFLAHDAHRAPVAALLQAAYHGGRLPERIRPAVLQALAGSAGHERAAPRALVEAMKTDPAVREAIVAGAEVQLRARREFLAGNDAGLLALHAGRAVDNASDELVLLLTLAAARHGDRDAFDKWSAAMVARDPRPEIRQWTRSLFPTAGD